MISLSHGSLGLLLPHLAMLTGLLGFCKFSDACEQVRGLEDCQCVESLEQNGCDA